MQPLRTKEFLPFRRLISSCVALALSATMIMPPQLVQAQSLPPTSGMALNLPAPGTMVTLSPAFAPPLLKGIKLFPDNALRFDFIIDTGDANLEDQALKQESAKLIKYFLASLTVPEEDLWVNLSPYEQDRIIPQEFGITEMGRDLLAQDYLLKQLTASLMYPEQELGQKFWAQIYKMAQEKYGTTEIPVNTFNKVWIVPEKAVVYENGDSAFVVESRLKVMMDSDYEAQKKGDPELVEGSKIETEVIREIIIPEIEREVNEGKNFAPLRQIYHSLILAAWFKKNLKESILGKVYLDQNKTDGINIEDKQAKEKIYNQYLEAFKKGVYNYIKEDYDPATQETIPRKYFSGGIQLPLQTNLAGIISGSSPILKTVTSLGPVKTNGSLASIAVVIDPQTATGPKASSPVWHSDSFKNLSPKVQEQLPYLGPFILALRDKEKEALISFLLPWLVKMEKINEITKRHAIEGLIQLTDDQIRSRLSLQEKADWELLLDYFVNTSHPNVIQGDFYDRDMLYLIESKIAAELNEPEKIVKIYNQLDQYKYRSVFFAELYDRFLLRIRLLIKQRNSLQNSLREHLGDKVDQILSGKNEKRNYDKWFKNKIEDSYQSLKRSPDIQEILIGDMTRYVNLASGTFHIEFTSFAAGPNSLDVSSLKAVHLSLTRTPKGDIVFIVRYKTLEDNIGERKYYVVEVGQKKFLLPGEKYTEFILNDAYNKLKISPKTKIQLDLDFESQVNLKQGYLKKTFMSFLGLNLENFSIPRIANLSSFKLASIENNSGAVIHHFTFIRENGEAGETDVYVNERSGFIYMDQNQPFREVKNVYSQLETVSGSLSINVMQYIDAQGYLHPEFPLPYGGKIGKLKLQVASSKPVEAFLVIQKENNDTLKWEFQYKMPTLGEFQEVYGQRKIVFNMKSKSYEAFDKKIIKVPRGASYRDYPIIKELRDAFDIEHKNVTLEIWVTLAIGSRIRKSGGLPSFIPLPNLYTVESAFNGYLDLEMKGTIDSLKAVVTKNAKGDTERLVFVGYKNGEKVGETEIVLWDWAIKKPGEPVRKKRVPKKSLEELQGQIQDELAKAIVALRGHPEELLELLTILKKEDLITAERKKLARDFNVLNFAETGRHYGFDINDRSMLLLEFYQEQEKSIAGLDSGARDILQNMYLRTVFKDLLTPKRRAQRLHELQSKSQSNEFMNSLYRRVNKFITEEMSYQSKILRTRLRPHQSVGSHFLVNHERALLADFTGGGKSVEVLGAIDPAWKMFIAVPSRLGDNWLKEIYKHIKPEILKKLKIVDLRQARNDKDFLQMIRATRNQKGVIILGSIERLRKKSKRHLAALNHNLDLLIVDEAQYIINYRGDGVESNAQQAEAIQYVEAKRKWFLSATGYRSNPKRLFGILSALAKGTSNELVYKTYRQFAQAFSVKKADGLIYLRSELNKYMLRRQEDDVYDRYEDPSKIPLEDQGVRLPNLNEIPVDQMGGFDLNQEQQKLLLRIINNFADFAKWYNPRVPPKMKLRKKDMNPLQKFEFICKVLIDPRMVGGTTKPKLWEELENKIDAYLRQGKKGVLYIKNHFVRDYVLQRYANKGIVRLDGQVRGYARDRSQKVIRGYYSGSGELVIDPDNEKSRPIPAKVYNAHLFQNDPKIKLIVASERMAEGLDFTEGEFMIQIQLPEYYVQEVQMDGRVVRADENRPRYQIDKIRLIAQFSKDFILQFEGTEYQQLAKELIKTGTPTELLLTRLQYQKNVFSYLMADLLDREEKLSFEAEALYKSIPGFMEDPTMQAWKASLQKNKKTPAASSPINLEQRQYRRIALNIILETLGTIGNIPAQFESYQNNHVNNGITVLALDGNNELMALLPSKGIARKGHIVRKDFESDPVLKEVRNLLEQAVKEYGLMIVYDDIWNFPAINAVGLANKDYSYNNGDYLRLNTLPLLIEFFEEAKNNLDSEMARIYMGADLEQKLIRTGQNLYEAQVDLYRILSRKDIELATDLNDLSFALADEVGKGLIDQLKRELLSIAKLNAFIHDSVKFQEKLKQSIVQEPQVKAAIEEYKEAWKKFERTTVKIKRESSSPIAEIALKLEKKQSNDLGGIDLTPAHLDLETKGAGIDTMPAFDLQQLESMPITGFTPIIIQITPVTNLPLLLGASDPLEHQPEEISALK